MDTGIIITVDGNSEAIIVTYEYTEKFFDYLIDISNKSPSNVRFVEDYGIEYIHNLTNRVHLVKSAGCATKLKNQYDTLYQDFMKIKQILDKGNHGLELFF